ncbi:MAG TPA: cytochrome c [bacterium]|nr:cytochrome c [bacterium]
MKRALPFVVLAAALQACSGCSNGTSSAPAFPPEAPLDPPWAGKVNPLPNTPEVLERGRASFQKNCAPCHGADGDGKGPAAQFLNPPPANFRDGVRLASHSDAYLFMRLAVGKHETAMPSFAGTLPEEDRWAIIRFLRAYPGAQDRVSGGS